MTGAAPTTVDPVHHFVGDFASWVRDDHDIRYCFIIGAGASRSSGIPTGASLVDGWLRTRYQQERPNAAPDGIRGWAEETFRWPGFSWATRAAFYGRLYEWFYPDNATGQTALRRLMRDKSPSFGYSVLAHIVARTSHRVVITTNIDNLARDAIALYVPGCDPFVCHGRTTRGSWRGTAIASGSSRFTAISTERPTMRQKRSSACILTGAWPCAAF
jgi:hypothetical protein